MYIYEEKVFCSNFQEIIKNRSYSTNILMCPRIFCFEYEIKPENIARRKRL